jgi:dTDP-4-dehydrorhamnose reductase
MTFVTIRDTGTSGKWLSAKTVWQGQKENMKKKVMVLGGSGMLGSMVVDYLSRDPGLEVTATTRSAELATVGSERLSGVAWQTFDATAADVSEALGFLRKFEWVINCIGIIKPLIHDDNAADVEQAVRVNSYFPHLLARWTEGHARVLQIATDCVYSGAKGLYTETDVHDALDVYGKTKSLGEVNSTHVHHLRCSIIGPEMKAPRSLMEWFLGQPQHASVNGFTNHDWNGVTTLHFAKLCGGIIKENIALPHLQHVIPTGAVTKYEMLGHFARCYARNDLTIKPTEAATIIDRTLSTNQDDLNRELWDAAGYSQSPTVPLMIEELARFDYRSNVKGVYA